METSDDSQNLEKSSMLVHAYNLNIGQAGYADPWDSLVSQPSLFDNFQANERPSPKK